MIVDFHTHLFPPRIKEERGPYLERDLGFKELYSNPKASIAAVEDLIASMDRACVDVSVVVGFGWESHELCVETNNYIIEAVSRYPGRLVGFCTVQPLAGEVALDEIARCGRAGLRGIGEMRPDHQGFNLADPQIMAPLAQTAGQFGMVFLTHASEPVGHLYPGKGRVTPDVLFAFLAAFPNWTVILAHWGGGLPFYALMPEVAETLANTYFDTAASPLLYKPQIFKVVAELVGPNKILFASDFPLLSQERFLETVRALEIPQNMKEIVLGGNARRLLGLP